MGASSPGLSHILVDYPRRGDAVRGLTRFGRDGMCLPHPRDAAAPQSGRRALEVCVVWSGPRHWILDEDNTVPFGPGDSGPGVFVEAVQSRLGARDGCSWPRVLCACAPLILLLSHQKGRFTFGDSGSMNYAWYVSPRTFTRNWQGEVPGSGTPVHPTRQLLRAPSLFEFDGPVVGTYPPWTDPSYWNEGLRWHFKFKPQLEVLTVTVPSEARLLIRTRPELVAGVVVLALLVESCGSPACLSCGQSWRCRWSAWRSTFLFLKMIAISGAPFWCCFLL